MSHGWTKDVDTVDDRNPIAGVIEALCAANTDLPPGGRRPQGGRPLPSRESTAAFAADLRAAMFPEHFGSPGLVASELRSHVATRLEQAQETIQEQVRRGLSFTCDHIRGHGDCPTCDRRARHATYALLARLPDIRALLETDVKAAFVGDPAAKFPDEALLCYPGVAAITQHRIAHELYLLSVPLIPRILSELAHVATGIDIHPGARIGGSFFIDHGTGVVIGETCSIGERVRIYQGVTLGARGFPADEQGHPLKGLPRHPVVEDDVIIYAGATILGRITIGRGATVGGNVWLTSSVAPGARISQADVRHQLIEEPVGSDGAGEK
jgi:serine O-acetyltransferase